METTTHVSWSRRTRIALTALIVGVLMIPAGLDSLPAVAVGATPGPIPSVNHVSTGPGSATITWATPWTDGDAPVDDYRIDVREAGGSWYTFNDGVSPERRATVTGLVAGRTYDIRVAARNSNGDGPATTLGIMTKLKAQFSDLCGEEAPNRWRCFANQDRIKSYPYSVYPDNQHYDLVTDLVDFNGNCAISASVGVICSTNTYNKYGELGQGFLGGPSGTFIVPGLPTDMVAIRSTGQRACALESSGELWCWGRMGGSYPYLTLLSPTIVKRNIAQFEGDCARARDNTVECLNADGQWTSIPMMPLITKLATSSDGSYTCGITDSKSVLCFNTVTKSMLLRPGWDNVVDIVSGTALCALFANGSVKCYGNNSFGELGNGTLTSGYSDVRLPEAALSLVSLLPYGSSSAHYNCAVGVSGTVYCWGDFIGRFSTGLTTSTIPLAVRAPAAGTVQSMPVPGPVTGLVQSGRSTNQVTVRWDAVPSTGFSPVDGYIVRWTTDGGISWTADVTRTNSWYSPVLSANSAILVSVAAFNSAGAGGDNAITAATTYPPARPTSLREISHTGSTATVGWVRSSDEDEPVTAYQVQWSSNGSDWNTSNWPASATSVTVSGLPAASAIEIRVRAENAAGVSAWTSPINVSTSGLVSQTLRVVDSFGTPVVGGQVTWVSVSGAYRSALDYGLTVDGTVTFPVAPAGPSTITLTGIIMPGGAVANYRSVQLFGAGRTPTVTMPAEPSRSSHTVRVTLPDGSPVIGATVNASSLDQTAYSGDATYVTPAVVTSGITNEFGEVYLVGYSSETTTVSIEFNDGVLIQTKSSPLGRGDLSVELDEMPWVDPQIDTATANVGALVSIPVKSALPNSTVAATAPTGAAQTCAGRVLSARTNADGVGTLKVCASATGTFKVKSAGAVSTGAVTVFAKGTKSLAVRNALAVSRSHQTANVSWTAPVFTGGNPITGYTVKMTSPTGAVVTKTVMTTSAAFTGLTGAKTYTVTVTPNTRLGAGASVVVRVPIS